jgi:16S rRNA processing protein RimM
VRPDDSRYAVLGRLGRPHGVRGEVTLDAFGLSPDELLEIGRFRWRGDRGVVRELELVGARGVGQRLALTFSGVDDRDKAASMTNGELLVERALLPDPGPDTAYTFQLIGLRVVTEDGRELGTLAGVQSAGHPLYVVRGEKEMLIPATPAFVQSVDLKAGVVTVTLPAGMEEL